MLHVPVHMGVDAKSRRPPVIARHADVQAESKQEREEAAVGSVDHKRQGRAGKELQPREERKKHAVGAEEEPQLEAPGAGRKHSRQAVHCGLLSIDGFTNVAAWHLRAWSLERARDRHAGVGARRRFHEVGAKESRPGSRLSSSSSTHSRPEAVSVLIVGDAAVLAPQENKPAGEEPPKSKPELI